MDCAVAQALEQIGDWWTLLIVRDAFNGAETFGQFQQGLGIARNILTQRLGALVDNGILERRPVKPDVERYGYHLTAKGKELAPVIIALMQWGDRWVLGGKAPLRIVDKDTRETIRQVEIQAADGRSLAFSDLRFRLKEAAAP